MADALAADDQQLVMATALALGAALAARLVTVHTLRVPIRRLGFAGPRSVGAEVIVGLTLGAVPALLVAAVFVLTGGSVERFVWSTAGVVRVVGYGLLLFVAVALFEEWTFRQYLLEMLAPRVGTAWAVIIGAALFAAAHLTNQGALSGTSVLAVFGAGIGLGIAYVVTRSLWIPVAWHLAWNFTYGSVLGFTVSGEGVASLFRVVGIGSDWWTGGDFGPEASVLCVVAVGLAVLAFAVMARRVPPENWSGRGEG
jgi:membrane protease YdiL (CAAX protease family)